MITKYVAFCCLLTAVTAASVLAEPGPSEISAHLIKAGLTDDNPATPSADAAVDQSQPCAGVSFSRGLKYGESDLNVLDVATSDSKDTSPRPVLMFVAGESFAGEGGMPAAAVQDQAMCFAARNGMVGVKVNYRLAPVNPWPAGARDVAAAASWIYENIDLFGGNHTEIVAVGYSVGAFHVASLLAHPEFQVHDSDLAAAVLVSGIYHSGAEASDAEKSYFGADASKYQERSAFPGILNIDIPILLAWSALDPPRLVTQGEGLKQRLCNSLTHCPHTTVLKSRDSLAAAFGSDPASGSLAGPTLELVREIEARGLP
ncbi:MAG: alpha/beta hydrolase [Bradyrhizobium sp.]|uniref:alpha/beta hydrolase n=1 Tax=Bradyrhizobium sp. TaxID=376 RepID=UPI003C3E9CA9